MQLFSDGQFSYNLLRTMGHAVYGGADIGECLATADRIQSGDFDSWHAAWLRTADRVRKLADDSMDRGQPVSARQAYLRACNYYRTAEFFLHSHPDDPRILTTWSRSRECFSQAALLSPQLEAIKIPYHVVPEKTETTLPGYFYQVDDSGKPRPTLIWLGGMDSTLEELHFFGAAAAVLHGYNCLTFEGPGQGQVIRLSKLPFRPDWENVVTPVVDYALTRADVDPQHLVLVGQSFGGLLAIQAAASEHRFAACVAQGGAFDLHESFIHLFPEHLHSQLVPGNDAAIDSLVNAVMAANEGARPAIGNAMWTFGVASPSELVRTISSYTLKDVAGKVSCPTLVIDAEKESFFPGHPKRLYEALTCAKDYLLFTSEEGAQEHCQVGALEIFHQRLFAWLDETLKVRAIE